eukprot:gnl/TRDRNA2_/TRDRNA2_154072_c0_seq1.p1 gnl/TRDRNA2_/TRDRNA2_154072_c0~~gnl/TRDRNA2_/TRDRNA2_154072_c0_seq1.p1  ORF type:complete len:292 (+),score=19.29 gnl/TRDRNA2_/TRDRNA2_154072_c0_seq1:345-1220(+)
MEHDFLTSESFGSTVKRSMRLTSSRHVHLMDLRHLRRRLAEALQVQHCPEQLIALGSNVSLLFVGSTSVGKTEMEVLQDHLCASGPCEPFIPVDFSEEQTVSKLIVSPPGYVDSWEPGTPAHHRQGYPDCLISFDQVEKAHKDVLNLLLAALDEGQMKDQRGQTIAVNMNSADLLFTLNVAPEVVQSLHESGGQQMASHRGSCQLCMEDLRCLSSSDVSTGLRRSFCSWIKPSFAFPTTVQESYKKDIASCWTLQGPYIISRNLTKFIVNPDTFLNSTIVSTSKKDAQVGS